MLARLHLVRHGEVHNPGGVVYSDLPDFPLSATGRRQAAAAAHHLAASTAAVLVSSPLDRARETAAPIAARLELPVAIHPGLTEWGLSLRWAGARWEDLDDVFPGELAAYADNPAALAFSPESLAALADRAEAVVTALGMAHPGATAIVVSHQDPIQALRLRLRGLEFDDFHHDKPEHASVITLERATTSWTEVEHWAPPGGNAFPPPVEPGDD